VRLPCRQQAAKTAACAGDSAGRCNASCTILCRCPGRTLSTGVLGIEGVLTAALASPHVQVFGRIDHLVSNAAVNPTAGPILDAPEEAIDKVGHLSHQDVHSSNAAPTYCTVIDQLLHRIVC
jgi:NAD(P)-dependent dehydrogenase (short-subunit alcohol dehydrogenase family)